MICKHCQQEKPHFAHGLCKKCYTHFRSIEDRKKLIDCPQCGKRKPIGSRGLCESCYAVWRYHQDPEKQRQRDRARWEKRREKENERRKLNYKRNKEHHLALSHRYHELHYDEIREQQAGYRQQHLEEIRERNRNYNQTKRDHAKELARLREWAAKQPKEKLDAIHVLQHQRRAAREKSLPYTLTRQEWEQIKERFGNHCAYCGEHFDHLTQDHVIPLSRGGAYTAENIVPACRSCNSKKGDMTADEFIAKIRGSK